MTAAPGLSAPPKRVGGLMSATEFAPVDLRGKNESGGGTGSTGTKASHLSGVRDVPSTSLLGRGEDIAKLMQKVNQMNQQRNVQTSYDNGVRI